MNDQLKALVGTQKRLQEILGCGRVQAWRIWTGKSNLTPINEKYIKMVLEGGSKSEGEKL